MKLIDKVILKDLVGPFINGMFMFILLVFTAGFLFQATTLLVQGVPLVTVMKFILYILPSIVTQTFPMAMLLASLMAFGRLSSDREAVALFAAGISFPRMVRAVIGMGIVVSGAAFLWNELVVPPATTAATKLQREAVEKLTQSDKQISIPLMSADNKVIEGFLKIDRGFDARTHTVRGVTLTRYSLEAAHKGETEVEVHCDHAVANGQQGLDWTYYQGYLKITEWDKNTGLLESVHILDFEELHTLPRGATMGKSISEIINSQRSNSDTRSFRDLREEIRSDYKKQHLAEARGKEVDLYGKIALPLASIVFGLVGAALGISTQRGASRTVGFGMALFIVFVYWVFYRAMWVAGQSGSVSPMLAAFLADIVGLAVGLALAVRASR